MDSYITFAKRIHHSPLGRASRTASAHHAPQAYITRPSGVYHSPLGRTLPVDVDVVADSAGSKRTCSDDVLTVNVDHLNGRRFIFV